MFIFYIFWRCFKWDCPPFWFFLSTFIISIWSWVLGDALGVTVETQAHCPLPGLSAPSPHQPANILFIMFFSWIVSFSDPHSSLDRISFISHSSQVDRSALFVIVFPRTTLFMLQLINIPSPTCHARVFLIVLLNTDIKLNYENCSFFQAN